MDKMKETVEKLGKVASKEITWEDLKDELEAVVNTKNQEYAESFRKARLSQVQIEAQKFMRANPYDEKTESKESYSARVNAYIKDFLDQTPDEFMRELRIFSHLGQSIITQIINMVGEFRDFKEVYLALNEKGIQEYAERHKEEIEAQQKAIAQAQINQERHERAVANKEKLDKKLGKK